MSFSCLLRNSGNILKATPLKNVFLQNHLKLSSSISRLTPVTNNSDHQVCKPTKLSQLEIVKQLSTSPVARSAHGDHTKIWTAERALAAAMIGVLPAAMLMPSQAMDTLMALTIVMHMHWGIEAVVIDYVRPVIFGTVVPKIGVALVYILSIATLAGLLNFIFNDVGLANGIRLFWKL
ncbi:succinate dehydrogenase [ubiquinone] cytochrome b small subunit, mitochondrial [Macrosteles quadrilineatus]|uniref:succinate dehydrogenase [ubiquinone] cytochrome b small subunit, mitochondrial n=1 Tax=Macrosteles quadrilineatus TaxID=74068 RepID=UPI0023E17CE3|nr:succinate dehydrogenase [ubiquinone] cytochrome b small subunit, mitochondrial [Macrosteles quadrilineatus]